MRVYVPSTVAGLRAALAAGEVSPIGGIAFGVTPSLRVEYEGAGEEEYEYLAMRDAAVAALRLIAAEDREQPGDEAPAAPRASSAVAPIVGFSAGSPPASESLSDSGFPALRVVIALDVETAPQRPDLDRAAVALEGPVGWSAVAAVHIDSADAIPVVRAAAAVVDAADLGDPDAEFTLGAAEDIDLCWYHPSEVSFLISELGG